MDGEIGSAVSGGLLSSEGVTFVSRLAFAAALILVTAIVQALVGPNKRRRFYMGIGALGGMAVGIAIASFMSRRTPTEISVIFGCLGILAGWGVAWRFARHLPREAH